MRFKQSLSLLHQLPLLQKYPLPGQAESFFVRLFLISFVKSFPPSFPAPALQRAFQRILLQTETRPKNSPFIMTGQAGA